MTINVIHATQAVNKKPIWFFVHHIVTITTNEQGNAVIHTVTGQATAITETPEAVFKTLKGMLGGISAYTS